MSVRSKKMTGQLFVLEEKHLEELISLKKTVVPVIKQESQEDRGNVVKEVADYFEWICNYHEVQMTPDLRNSQNEADIVNCFIQHRQLFYLYGDVFRYEPYMTVRLGKRYSENSEKLLSSFKTLSSHLENCINVLKHLYRSSLTQEALDIVEGALEERADPTKSIKFVLAEIIESEGLYINELENLITNIYPLINDTKYVMKTELICGKTKDIYKTQKLFYEDLIRCLYDSDIYEIMDCFLKYERHFALYSEDIALKGNTNLIKNFKIDRNIPLLLDVTATFSRLISYKSYLEKAKKISVKHKNEEAVIKIEEVEKMINKILNEADQNVQDIKGANIYIETLGSLKASGIFKIKPALSAEEFPGMVYLFEKALVVTKQKKDERRNDSENENYYEGHIITTMLGFNYQENQKTLQVYFQEKFDKKYIYNLTSGTHTLTPMKNAIEELLQAQILEAKDRLSCSY